MTSFKWVFSRMSILTSKNDCLRWLSPPVIGLYNNTNPKIMATKGSRLDSIDAFLI